MKPRVELQLSVHESGHMTVDDWNRRRQWLTVDAISYTSMERYPSCKPPGVGAIRGDEWLALNAQRNAARFLSLTWHIG